MTRMWTRWKALPPKCNIYCPVSISVTWCEKWDIHVHVTSLVLVSQLSEYARPTRCHNNGGCRRHIFSAFIRSLEFEYHCFLNAFFVLFNHRTIRRRLFLENTDVQIQGILQMLKKIPPTAIAIFVIAHRPGIRRDVAVWWWAVRAGPDGWKCKRSTSFPSKNEFGKIIIKTWGPQIYI